MKLNINLNRKELSSSRKVKLHRLDTNKKIKSENKNKNENKIKNKLFNVNKSNIFKNFFCFKKAKNIILIIILILIIIGLILFLIYYYKHKNKKIPIKLQEDINTKNIDGYYIPKDNLKNPIYKKCSINNCKKCYGTLNNDTCISCFPYSNPILNEYNKIISCDIINITLDESNELISTNNTQKIKTELNNIITTNIPEIQTELNIEINSTNIIDEKTELNTEINSTDIFDEKTEIINDISTNELVLSTKDLTINNITEDIARDTFIELINCDPGYYLPSDKKNDVMCKECSLFGCEICHGNSSINYCDICYSKYIPVYNNDTDYIIKCKECNSRCIECNQKTFECLKCDFEYVLIKGKCLSYSIAAVYIATEDNQIINFININGNNNRIREILFDYETAQINSNAYITFKYKGNHTIYFIMEDFIDSLSDMFYSVSNLISINFTSYFLEQNG